MTNVTNLTTKVERDIEEIMEVIMDQIGSKTVKEMTAEEFKIMKGIFNLVDSTTALLHEYGRVIEDIDKKLDVLIKNERS